MPSLMQTESEDKTPPNSTAVVGNSRPDARPSFLGIPYSQPFAHTTTSILGDDVPTDISPPSSQSTLSQNNEAGTKPGNDAEFVKTMAVSKDLNSDQITTKG